MNNQPPFRMPYPRLDATAVLHSPAPEPGHLSTMDHKLLVELITMVMNQTTMSADARKAFSLVLERIQGTAAAKLPDLVTAIQTWMLAMLNPDITAAREACQNLHVCIAHHGDLAGAESLSKLLTEVMPVLHGTIMQAQNISRAGGAGGAGGSQLDEPGESAAAWTEPGDPIETAIMEGELAAEIDQLVEDLQNAAMYRECGIDAPTRVLMCGQPGNGKTTIAREVARRLGVPLGLARLDTLVSSFTGKAAKNLRATFNEAVEKKGILFLDEIDGLCQRRDAVAHGGGDESKKITTALQQQFDLLTREHPEFVIFAATNMPESLDPALRGRFDTEITVLAPSPDARRTMLTGWWAGTTAKYGVDADAMNLLVTRSEGKSGRWLHKVAMRAGRSAIKAKASLNVTHARRAEAVAGREGELKTTSSVIALA